MKKSYFHVFDCGKLLLPLFSTFGILFLFFNFNFYYIFNLKQNYLLNKFGKEAF